MLYRLERTSGAKFDKLTPVAFKDLSHFGHIEKDLEDIIADNLLDVLFEESGLLPICQERPYQAEADVYALNEKGDLILFELKRSATTGDAVHQLLRYAQDAGLWSYDHLQERYARYKPASPDLRQAHQGAFGLAHPLDARDFNQRQHLMVIGSASDATLVRAIEYWQGQGLSIRFLPYRVYELGCSPYFEFFAPPFDQHANPGDAKGVLFDTNRTWDPESLWYMLEQNRIAAFGDAKRFIEFVYPGDIVFFSHSGHGVVAGARVTRSKKGALHDEEADALYREVEFITPVPQRGMDIKAMPFHLVTEITGKSFFWARTIKVPYLTKGEAEMLANRLTSFLQEAA